MTAILLATGGKNKAAYNIFKAPAWVEDEDKSVNILKMAAPYTHDAIFWMLEYKQSDPAKTSFGGMGWIRLGVSI